MHSYNYWMARLSLYAAKTLSRVIMNPLHKIHNRLCDDVHRHLVRF